jgi:GDYXXLXY protein
MKSFGALLGLFDRIPEFVLFGAAAVIQVALIVAMVADRVQILRTGTEVTLQTRPIDPRDFLRGDYVVLGYDISTVSAGELKDQPATGKGTTVFVKLAPNGDGFYEAVSAHAAPVAVNPPEVLTSPSSSRRR